MPNICADTPSGPIPQAPELLAGAGVVLSEKAAEHIRKSLEARGRGMGLRLGVGASGCSGLSYKLEYADEASADDHVFESHGVKVVVDDKSLPFLQGVVLNWAREGLNEGFKFENPNVKNSCGCGESFTV